MEKKVNHYTAEGLLLLITVFWGTSFILVKDSIKLFDVAVFNSLRFFISALCFLPFCIKHLPQMTFRDLKLGIILGIFLFLGFFFQSTGLIYTDASKSAFITGLFVVLVPIFYGIYYRKLPRAFPIAGAIIAFAGIALMTSVNLNLNIGDLLTFLCAVSFALQILLTGKFVKSSNVYVLTLIQLLVVAVLSALTMPFYDRKILLSTNGLLSICFLAVFATTLAYYIQTSMQRYTTETKTAVIFIMEPVFGALFAVFYGKESLSTMQWIGGGIVILGMLVSEIGDIVFVKYFSRKAG